MKTILILGAKSDIGKAIAIKYYQHGYNLILAGRNVEEHFKDVKDSEFPNLNSKISYKELDIIDPVSIRQFNESFEDYPDGIISCIGLLGDQKKGEMESEHAKTIIYSNFTGIVEVIEGIANEFEKHKSGFIIGISSVAGERGRQNNYYYGAAKAAFTTYLSGLRNRLYKSNVQVMTVIPGYVNTKMTEGMNLPKWLTVSPEFVADSIYINQQNGKDIIYTPKIWYLITFIIRKIPEKLFKRMNL